METAGISENVCRITTQYNLWYYNLPQQITFHDRNYTRSKGKMKSKCQYKGSKPEASSRSFQFLMRRHLQHVTFLSKELALSQWHYSEFTNEENTWEKILPFNLKIYVVLKRDCWVGLVPQPLNPRCNVPATPPPPNRDPTPLSSV